jgi:TolA-binding protein
MHLRRRVEEATAVNQSAITLINGLAQQIRDLKEDPAKLEELAQRLDASSNALAAAVSANTVAEDEEDETGETGEDPTGGESPTTA